MTIQTAAAQDTIQKRWAIEARGGANYAINKLGDANLDVGYGFEGTVAFRFIGPLAVYGGWGYNHFTSDQYFEGSKLDFDETGYTFGLQLINSFPNSKVGYLIKGGAIYNHIETENSAGVIINDTGHGFGWQGGLGINLPLGSRLRITPEIRYRSLSRNITLNNITKAVDLNYISANVGLAFLF
jgi:hypothetical protein